MTHVRIVIASVLKPLYEPRMYEKIGISLSEIPNTEVHVMGYGIEGQLNDDAIKVHGLGSFSRLSLKRLITPWRILIKVFKLKPQVLVACTHELLLPFVFYKLFSPTTKLVYDLQENYFLNIVHTNAFPWFLKFPLALWIRIKERIALPFYSLVLSAEQCYVTEMPFIQAKAVCIENKALTTRSTNRSFERINTIVLYTGTISESYGIYDAIALVEKMNVRDAGVSMVIRGYCAHALEAKKLNAYIKNKRFIDVNDITKPVAYTEIIAAMANATVGLISYQANKATCNRIPTKLYEYMANKLPVIATENKTWSELIAKYHAGLSIDYTKPPLDVLEKLKSSSFYDTSVPLENLLWSVEKEKLQRCFLPLVTSLHEG